MPTSKETLERLLYIIVTKKEPKLVDNLKVIWGGRANYEISRNGKGVVLKVGLGPGDKRLGPILTRASRELLLLIEGRPFFTLHPNMTPNERLGWDELVSLGARPFSNDPHTLDIRRIPLRQRGGVRMDLTRFAKALSNVISNDPGEGANGWQRDGQGQMIGVYTKERKNEK